MFSREIIHMYKTGETDPRALLQRLMKEAAERDDGEEDNLTMMRFCTHWNS